MSVVVSSNSNVSPNLDTTSVDETYAITITFRTIDVVLSAALILLLQCVNLLPAFHTQTIGLGFYLCLIQFQRINHNKPSHKFKRTNELTFFSDKFK